MSIQAGLVGLPNVGKSTLFNALTRSSVPAENYPFCTINPHVAITEVPDERLLPLKTIYKSQTIIPSTVTFVDIAGLVKGAASGEGLGNQFLGHIREVDLILHVVRCFEDPSIISSATDIDPVNDYEIIVAELMLKDLESVAKRIEKVHHLLKSAKNKPAELKELQAELELLETAQAFLDEGNNVALRKCLESTSVSTIPLLSAKKFLIIANIAEASLENKAYEHERAYRSLIERFGSELVIPISAKIEWELSQLSSEEAHDLMQMLHIPEQGLASIIRKTYEHLGLITFFTCGPREIHAWPIKSGRTIRSAAGEIHSDLERGFICAEIMNYHDLVACGSETKLREKGKARTEGQDYIVHDGDIVLVKFNV